MKNLMKISLLISALLFFFHTAEASESEPLPRVGKTPAPNAAPKDFLGLPDDIIFHTLTLLSHLSHLDAAKTLASLRQVNKGFRDLPTTIEKNSPYGVQT